MQEVLRINRIKHPNFDEDYQQGYIFKMVKERFIPNPSISKY
jgi:hypothetical protein